jgi:eukaryotic-like serine/threonine-protein kinase
VVDGTPEPQAPDDAQPAEAAGTADGLVGRTLADRYRIEAVVSAGAYTIITVALDQTNHQPVTLKIVRPELVERPGFAEDFVRHCEAGAALTHPNIASVLDWGPVETADLRSTWFWTVEYLAGGSLRDLLDRGRQLEPSQALVVGLEACRALDLAHQRGIVHTEITPSKLVFGDDRRLRVVDFGLAELLGAEAWENPANVPTHVARYASPEQALGMDVDAKTDVYALSLSLIEAVTGSVPFAGDSTMSTLAGRVGKLMPVSADLGSLAAVLERAGRPDSEDRSTAAEFGRGLVQSAATLPRPEPIPLIATGLFTTVPARQPDDPTGGHERPIIVPTEPVAPTPVVPLDPDAPVEPLIVMTDISDDPAHAPAIVHPEPTREMVIGATEQMPVSSPPVEGSPETTAVSTTAMSPSAAPAGAISGTVVFDAERPKGRKLKVAVGSILFLAAIGALAVAGWALVRTKSYTVPDLVGIQEEVALNEISGNDWTVERDLERSDEFPEPGTVIRTVPNAGVKLDEGETFVLYVSEGPKLRVLPDVTGLPLAEAQAELNELRLVPVEGTPVYSEDVPAGSVISWSVQDDAALVAGDEVLPDTAIVLVLSQGPEPRPAPDLANLTLDEATATTAAVQLLVVEGEQLFSNDVEVGRVIAQTPAVGTPVERGGTVTVQLSKGPDLVPFPDLTGQVYADAQTTLAGAGYAVNSLLGTTEGTFVSASIDGEPVEPGATFLRGTAVDLVFL